MNDENGVVYKIRHMNIRKEGGIVEKGHHRKGLEIKDFLSGISEK